MPFKHALAHLSRRALLFAAACALAGCAGLSSSPASREIHVMTSGGFTAPYNELTPQFEKASGHVVKTAYGASMGNASDSIPSRLARGEPGSPLWS